MNLSIIKKLREIFDKYDIKFTGIDTEYSDVYIYANKEFNIGTLQIFLNNKKEIKIPLEHRDDEDNYIMKFMYYDPENYTIIVGYQILNESLDISIVWSEEKGEYIRIVENDNETFIYSKDIKAINFIPRSENEN